MLPVNDPPGAMAAPRGTSVTPGQFAMHQNPPSIWPDFLAGQLEKPVRVLLVDDDAHMRRVIAQELMSDQRTLLVAQATSVREGRKAIKQHEFDVMLVDLNLGDGEGFMLIDYMKSVRPTAEAIVISIMQNDEQVLHAFELGATGYLVKNSWFGSYPQAVLQVANGGASITPNLARRLLQRLHRGGLAHNDLAKEANWLVLDDGSPAIIDFQLASRGRARSGSPARSWSTRPCRSRARSSTRR